jgi:hypothetical protein
LRNRTITIIIITTIITPLSDKWFKTVSQLLGVMKIARCGFPWKKTTKKPTASVYTNCETGLACCGW